MGINIGSTSPKDKRLAVIQVDGLSRNHLNQALGRGLMPHLKERLDRGTLNLDSYNSGLPSQTAVAIGGLLYGQMLPGNQWFDKQSQSVVDTFKVKDAGSVAQEMSENGEGIARNGSVYLSPLDGGADPKDSYFVFSDMSRVQKEQGKWGVVRTAASEFLRLTSHLVTHPFKALQSAVHFGSEIANDLRHKSETHRPLKTIVGDAFKETLIADASVQRIADQIGKGEEEYLYVDLANFDAKNHSFGVGPEAFATLPQIDRNLDTILDAVEESGTGYEIAILADHGSASGYPFHQVHGQTLQDLSQNLAPDHQVVALDFGSGAHIYLKDQPGKLERSELPSKLLHGLRQQPGIAFTVTCQGGDTLIESREGRVRVNSSDIKVEGKNPLSRFETDTDMAAHQIHDLAHRDKVGDVLVFGEHHKDGLINFSTSHHQGLHGGIGLDQTRPFVAWSQGLPLEPKKTRDASDLHKQLHEGYLRSQTST
jgi:type I phosphodiesterase/nucleotide pyrophosphatase